MLKNNLDVNLLWVTVSHFSRGSSVKAHAHSYHHLIHLQRGVLTCEVDGERFMLHAGDTLFARIGAMHSILPAEDELVIISEIKFTTPGHSAAVLADQLPVFIPGDDIASALLAKLVEESKLMAPGSDVCMSSYLLSLLYIWTADSRCDNRSESRFINTAGLSTPTIAIIRYIEENYASNMSLQQIADAVGYNKYYICNVFKQDMGITIGDCTTLIRVRVAAELISYSDISLDQVVKNTGLTNASHFNHVFKQEIGIPPGQYRKHFSADVLLKGDPISNAPISSLQKPYNEAFVVSVLAGKKFSGDDIMSFVDNFPAGEES